METQTAMPIDIPYQKFILSNGLTLLVHEDHKAPIVAVNIWYHVGAKNEKPGKTGFAHLFEHLMFNGSEHFNDDYFQAMERIGATDLNGTTNHDRTNYFQNVPTSAVDVALWMESDRMGYLLGAIDQSKLDEQRGVVQNEKRQGENQPYGKVEELITKSTYPAGHPYSWTVIGSMEDLDAASLEDVREWFRTYYGAANAVLTIAGDIDTQTARQKVENYFGDIPSGPPISTYKKWIAKRQGVQRQRIQDRVPQARIYQVWNIPEYGSADGDYLDLVSDILASGKTSRLYKRLVYDEQIATNVYAYVDLREIGGQFTVVATARPGVDISRIENSLNEEMDRFLTGGPTSDELRRVQAQFMAGFVRGIERIGGFGGKSDILAKNEVFTGNPEHYKITLERVRNATPQTLQTAANTWLSDGIYILEVHPFPDYKTVKTPINREHLPEPGEPPEAQFPELQQTELPNGLKIILAERHSVPVVTFNLLIDAGYASDQFALPGTAKLAMEMLDEGTQNRTSLQISEELDLLGAELQCGSNLDTSSVALSALKENLSASLDIFADIILNPIFPEKDFQRLKKIQLAAIQREKVTPVQMALRVFPKLLYGPSHAYGNPLTGSGTEDSVSKISQEDLIRFHKTWFKPNHATLVVVGDTNLNEIRQAVENLFQDWKPGTVPNKNIQPVTLAQKTSVFILDRPEALQSIIFAGHVAPPKANPEEIAIETMNNILGGTFTSRINMNLREDKHWAYGAFTFLVDARGPRPFIAYAPVQTDKTRQAMLEMIKEIKGIISDRPITAEELEKVRRKQILELPGSWETMAAVASSIAEIVQYNLPTDYFTHYAKRVKALNLEQVKAAAKHVLHPEKLVWVVVGDRKKIEPDVRKLGFSTVHFLDADGNPVS
ncbi:MAG: insulinase family protein [Calditrichaeota bacterium]|nr:insulinase family protein [Calditrichota bacterium]